MPCVDSLVSKRIKLSATGVGSLALVLFDSLLMIALTELLWDASSDLKVEGTLVLAGLDSWCGMAKVWRRELVCKISVLDSSEVF